MTRSQLSLLIHNSLHNRNPVVLKAAKRTILGLLINSPEMMLTNGSNRGHSEYSSQILCKYAENF